MFFFQFEYPYPGTSTYTTHNLTYDGNVGWHREKDSDGHPSWESFSDLSKMVSALTGISSGSVAMIVRLLMPDICGPSFINPDTLLISGETYVDQKKCLVAEGINSIGYGLKLICEEDTLLVRKREDKGETGFNSITITKVSVNEEVPSGIFSKPKQFPL